MRVCVLCPDDKKLYPKEFELSEPMPDIYRMSPL